MFRAAFRAKPTARLYIPRRLCSQYPNTCSTLALVLLLFARPQPIAMSPASRGTSRSQPLSAASPAGCPMMSVLTCSLPCQTILGCQVFCMLFCLRSFSIQICRKYTNNYLNINELFLEIPCSLTYPGEMKTKPQMPRCQWQQYSNKKDGRGRLKVVCFLLWGRSHV